MSRSDKILYQISRVHPWIVTLVAVLGLVGMALGTSFLYTKSGVFSATVGSIANGLPSDSKGALFVADMFAVSIDEQMVSVRWSVMGGCGSNFTINRTDGCSHNSLAIPVNLYLNKNASTPVNQSTPMLQYDPSDILTPPAAQYIPGRSSLPPTVFETDLTIDPFLPYTLFKKQSNLYYPFDQINSYVSLLAINPLTNETIPIASVIGYGTTVNWIGFAIFGTAPPLPGSDVAQFYATLSSHRQRLVKGVVIIIVITNWLLSLAILYMTILVILQRQVNTQLLLASTTVLFAIPQIRASMPDAPPFGAFVDTGGYFINLCLVSACTSVLLFFSLAPYENRMIRPYPSQSHGMVSGLGTDAELELMQLSRTPDSASDLQRDRDRDREDRSRERNDDRNKMHGGTTGAGGSVTVDVESRWRRRAEGDVPMRKTL